MCLNLYLMSYKFCSRNFLFLCINDILVVVSIVQLLYKSEIKTQFFVITPVPISSNDLVFCSSDAPYKNEFDSCQKLEKLTKLTVSFS